MAPHAPTLLEEAGSESPPAEDKSDDMPQPCLKSSATITIAPAAATIELARDATQEIVRDKGDEAKEKAGAKPRVVLKKKTSPTKVLEEKAPADKLEETKEEGKASAVASAADKLTSLSIAPTSPEPKTPAKPKKLSIPVVSKIAKPKAQSEDRDLNTKQDNGTVRLQQIGIEPSPTPAMDCEREDSRRRAARDIISSAIRTGKPPVPYGRSSSAGVASLVSPPGTPPGQPSRVFRTEAQHRVEDHRNANRGVSVERIIPISMSGEESPAPHSATPQSPLSPQSPQSPLQKPSPAPAPRTPLSEACSSPGAGEPIKKSAREFIIPIAVEGKGFVTPRQRSLEPESPAALRLQRPVRPRRISSLVSGGESEEEDDNHMHRLRPSRLARADSASSGEEDEEDEGFHLLTAENLFSTLLHRRSGRDRTDGEGDATEDTALDLSDLDLASIEFSEREMRALSGLTPALSRRSPERIDPLHYSTLPRLRRRSASRDTTPTPEPEAASATLGRRSAGERPLLSKYLTPERALSLDEPYPPDADSILTEPSYIAAYGNAGAGNGALRRHSLRLAGETPRKRVSRFLRSDFFDRPSDTEESLYAKHKKEKELETQRILREIREKRGRAEVGAGRTLDTPPPDDTIRKCGSPLGTLLGKERSRSNTPFFPSLDNIKETAIDASARVSKYGSDGKQRARSEDTDSRDSKLVRPKSYPVKTLDSIDEPSENSVTEPSAARETENKEKRESKLMRPKSYPTSSPSPEKVYISRTIKEESKDIAPKNEIPSSEVKTDVEVSFSITLPKKKTDVASKTDALKNKESNQNDTKIESDRKSSSTLLLKKYQIVNSTSSDKSDQTEHKARNGTTITNGGVPDTTMTTASEDTKSKASKKDETKKLTDSESSEKKGTIKKKIIRKVSSKSKTDLAGGQDTGDTKSTKKVTKKVKEKPADEDSTKSATVTKKKSVLQSIGHKLEKFASSKSSSPEKVAESSVNSDAKKSTSKLRRTQREQSVPATAEPPSESNLIKRAVTVTDVAALENQTPSNNKTTVSKVLGLFKKFEPKDKIKPIMEKSISLDTADIGITNEPANESDIDSLDKDKPRRPTSLLLNGLGRKNKYGRTSSDSVSNVPAENDEHKKENETKNKTSLKLDFSKLPRVKKIVPTNPVIEPQINYSSLDGETENKYISEKIARALENSNNIDHTNTQSHSRSRSRSNISNSEIKSDLSVDTKYLGKNPISPSENITSHPLRNYESTSPEKEDIVDRIRRKSFYSRFNEKKQRRKSSLVGPGATEYDPLARIHAPPTEPKYDVSPTSPGTYDLSPGLSATSDLSPSTERYRTLLSELPRTNLKYENYGLNDKIDTPKRTHNPAIILKESEKEPSPENILDKIRQRKNFSISVTRKPDRDTESLSRSPVPSKGESDGTECSEKVD
ncbi:Serine/threonine protein kinase [Operophtera brumata]|uniref:Serine/threonine protein kinase n=1 Tax=Operophtera brumata TaxID=104452 RepID=A0A0L7LKE4_OPEBR|nr:Serine/threonine protein kinase [Operophtera brumata]